MPKCIPRYTIVYLTSRFSVFASMFDHATTGSRRKCEQTLPVAKAWTDVARPHAVLSRGNFTTRDHAVRGKFQTASQSDHALAHTSILEHI